VISASKSEPDREIENDPDDCRRDYRERRGEGFAAAKCFHVWPAQENPEKARNEGGPFDTRTSQHASINQILEGMPQDGGITDVESTSPKHPQ
jgi:hypothetical protein